MIALEVAVPLVVLAAWAVALLAHAEHVTRTIDESFAELEEFAQDDEDDGGRP